MLEQNGYSEGFKNSSSIDAEVRGSDANNAILDKEASPRESFRGFCIKDSHCYFRKGTLNNATQSNVWKMTVEDILKEADPPIDGLREVFALYCKLFGIRQNTCLALTLMLDSRWALLMMITYFYQAQQHGDELTTTEVVLMAQKVREAQDVRKANGIDIDDIIRKKNQIGMVYLSNFSLMSESAEDDYLQYNTKSEYDSFYPMRFFTRPWKIEKIEFDTITIFCGSNGSGKSTLLNVIAEKLGIKRETPYNKTVYFDPYVEHCSDFWNIYDKEKKREMMQVSRIITSDDVFRHIIEVRKRNDDREFKRGVIRDEKRDMAFSQLRPTGFNADDPASVDAYLNYYKKLRTPTPKYVKNTVGFDERTYSNGENGFKYFTDNIQPGGLYLLDEPENSLSADLQIELVQFIQSMARFYDCQFIMSTHSPFLLSLPFARIYNMDEAPVKECKWTELPNVRLYHDFFKEHDTEF